MDRQITLTEAQHTTVVASLALAAQIYVDPTPVLDAIRAVVPNVDWTTWERDLRAARETKAANALAEAMEAR